MIPEKHKINYKNAAKKINNHIDAREFSKALEVIEDMEFAVRDLKYPLE